MNDFLGRELKAGQRIVYPGRRSSSLWMNEGIIERVDSGKLKVHLVLRNWRGEPSGKTKLVTLYCPGRTTIISN